MPWYIGQHKVFVANPTKNKHNGKPVKVNSGQEIRRNGNGNGNGKNRRKHLATYIDSREVLPIRSFRWN